MCIRFAGRLYLLDFRSGSDKSVSEKETIFITGRMLWNSSESEIHDPCVNRYPVHFWGIWKILRDKSMGCIFHDICRKICFQWIYGGSGSASFNCGRNGSAGTVFLPVSVSHGSGICVAAHPSCFHIETAEGQLRQKLQRLPEKMPGASGSGRR